MPDIKTNPRGVDLSRWNVAEGQHVDWEDFKKYYSFVIMKATESESYVDPRFQQLNESAAAVGVPRGQYHFYRFRGSSTSSKKQAKHFWDTIKYNPGEITPWGDFESPTGSLKISTKRDWVEKFLDSFEADSGRIPGVYTSPGWWNSNIANPIDGVSNIPRLVSGARSLWVAHWYTSDPSVPYDWRARYGDDSWEFWQDTNKGDGTPAGIPDTTIDLDWYNGTYEQFNQEFGTSIVPPVIDLRIHRET